MIDSQWPRFHVFEQRKEGAPHQNAGTLHASDGEIALMMARDALGEWPTPPGETRRISGRPTSVS